MSNLPLDQSAIKVMAVIKKRSISFFKDYKPTQSLII